MGHNKSQIWIANKKSLNKYVLYKGRKPIFISIETAYLISLNLIRNY